MECQCKEEDYLEQCFVVLDVELNKVVVGLLFFMISIKVVVCYFGVYFDMFGEWCC